MRGRVREGSKVAAGRLCGAEWRTDLGDPMSSVTIRHALHAELMWALCCAGTCLSGGRVFSPTCLKLTDDVAAG